MKPLHTHHHNVPDLFGQIGKFLYLAFIILVLSGIITFGASILVFEQMPDETIARKFLILWAIIASVIVGLMVRHSLSKR